MAKKSQHPAQARALKELKQEQVKTTERLLAEALDRLANGAPTRTDGRLTYDNVWREAGLSRSTLNRYPQFKTELDKVKSARNKKGKTLDDIHDKNRELMEMVNQLRAEKSDLQRQNDHLLAASKQEIMILNRKIEQLEQALSKSRNNVVPLRAVE